MHFRTLWIVWCYFFSTCCDALKEAVPSLNNADDNFEKKKLRFEMPDDDLADSILLHYAELSHEQAAEALLMRPPDDIWAYKTIMDDRGRPTNLTMDVYFPADYYTDLNKRYPIVVYYHGGSWDAGLTTIGWGHCIHYSTIHDIICVSVDYRLGKGLASIRSSVTDAKAAIRYLRFHSEALHVDITKIVAMGDSAGGHLAAATATTVDKSTNEDFYYKQGVSAVPDMLIMLNPYFRFFKDPQPGTDIKLMDLIWPEAIVRNDHNALLTLPPMITFIGEADDAYPAAHSFHESVVANGCESFFYLTKLHPNVPCEETNCLTASHGVYSPGMEDGYNPSTYYVWHITDLFMILNGIVPLSAPWTPL